LNRFFHAERQVRVILYKNVSSFVNVHLESLLCGLLTLHTGTLKMQFANGLRSGVCVVLSKPI
ncbi:MAG: hypothetical protein IJK81_11070, partial [Selenomonadaceae bacterium]|nr:hypothetical protein [Selenomonadaceae bacterium]